MRLLGVEVNRFFSRSAIQWLIVAVFLLGGLGALVALGPATPMSEADRAEAVRWFEEAHEDWRNHSQEAYESCVADEALERENDPEVDFGCDWVLQEPQLADWLWESSFAASGPDVVSGLVTGMLFVVLLAAVTFVAAEFSTGAISNWLTFEPRRTRVFFSKIGAVVVGAVPVVALGYVVAFGATWAPFAFYGTTGEVTRQAWLEHAAVAGRTVLAGVIIAVVGACLAFLLRHLAAALAVSIGWLLIVEQLAAVANRELQRWTFSNNLRALTEGSYTFYVDKCRFDDEGWRVCETVDRTISVWQGGFVLGGFALVAVIVALLVFRRRDVV